MIANQRIAVLTAALLLATLALETNAGGKAVRIDSTSKVKATVTATPVGADGKQVVTLMLDIDKGWHLYANPTENKTTEPARTIVTVKAKNKLTAQVQYPVGKVYVHAGDTYKIYQGHVILPVQIQRPLGDTSPLEVIVNVSACDADACLLPGTIRLSIP